MAAPLAEGTPGWLESGRLLAGRGMARPAGVLEMWRLQRAKRKVDAQGNGRARAEGVLPVGSRV